MKCLFCHMTDLKQVAEGKSVISYDCENCKVSFFFQDNKMVAWLFHKDYDGYRFFVTWLEQTNDTNITKCGKGEAMSKVTTLKGPAFLNPHNLLQKLPTILTFL